MLASYGRSQRILLSLQDWLAAESSLQVCLQQSKYFVFKQQIILSFFQTVRIDVVLTRII